MTPLLNRSAPAIPPRQPSAPIKFTTAAQMMAAMKADAARIGNRKKPHDAVRAERGAIIGGILSALECGEALNAAQISDKCGYSVTCAHKQITLLEKKGEVEIDRSKGRGKFTYKLVNP